MAQDDPYSDSYVPSEWTSLEHDDHSVSSRRNIDPTDDAPLSQNDTEDDDFEYKAFIESLNELSTPTPDTAAGFRSTFDSLDVNDNTDASDRIYRSLAEERNTYSQEPGNTVWNYSGAMSEEEDSEPLNSESYTEMTAYDSGYSVPHSQGTQLSDFDEYSDSTGYAFGQQRGLEVPQDPAQLSEAMDPKARHDDQMWHNPSASTSGSSVPQDSSPALVEKVSPPSDPRPQSSLSSVVVDRSSRRGGRHAQIKSRVLPASQRLRAASAELISRRKRRHDDSVPHPAPQPIPSSEESAGAFMTSTSWVLTVLVGLLSMFYWHFRQLGDDWASLWIAGLMVRNEQTDALYDRAWWDFGSTDSPLWSYYRDAFDIAPWPHPFVQAPMVAQFMGVLSHFMNYYWSLHLLAFLTGAALVITVVSAHYMWKKRPMDTRYLVMSVALLWISEPVTNASYIGQTTPILFALVLFGIAVSENHPYASGISLALATIIKLSPFVIIVILLFFVSRRRAAVSALITGLLSLVVSVSFIGPQIYATWLKELRVISSQAYVTANNDSLISLAYATRAKAILSVTTISDPAVSLKILALGVGVVLCLLVLAAASQLRERACEMLCVGVFVAALVSNNIYWSHYSFIVVALYMGIFVECTKTQKYIWPVAMVSLVFFYPPIAGGDSNSWQGSAYYATVFLVVLFCVAMVLEAHERFTLRWTPGLFFRNIGDFISTVISTGRPGIVLQTGTAP